MPGPRDPVEVFLAGVHRRRWYRSGGWLSWRGCDLGGRLGRWPGRGRGLLWCRLRGRLWRGHGLLWGRLSGRLRRRYDLLLLCALRRGCRCSLFRALDRRRHRLFGARVDAWCRDGRLWRLGLFRGVGRRWRYGRRLTRCGWCWSGRLRWLGRGSRRRLGPRQRLRRGWRNRRLGSLYLTHPDLIDEREGRRYRGPQCGPNGLGLHFVGRDTANGKSRVLQFKRAALEPYQLLHESDNSIGPSFRCTFGRLHAVYDIDAGCSRLGRGQQVCPCLVAAGHMPGHHELSACEPGRPRVRARPPVR